jgi:Squalene-hopene cyclase C-terminal domain
MRTHLLFVSFLLLPMPVRAAEPEPTPVQIKTAVTKSIPLLQTSAGEYVKHRECFSCHHQALPLFALTMAKVHGFDVSQETLDKQVAHTLKHLATNRDNYQKGRGQGGQVDMAGYGLFALEFGGAKADETTAAVTEYLLLRDDDRDFWRVSANRPPTEASTFTAAYVALRGLRKYGTQEQAERIEKRTAKVRQWLLATPAKDTEDRVFRLGALKLSGADAMDVKKARDELLKTQRDDGGWSQTDQLDSDAYATGTALVMLHEAGGLPLTDAAYRRGVKYLVSTQCEDGSWYVKSRSKPFQVYFESGFPYEKDQWISISATSWAMAALALTVLAK